MRLIRWVEGRISGRKSRLKDGSTTSADDQFVYHPSPFRQPLSHIATPAHNPPKLHHQLEQRLNEQINERLSGHFMNDQLDINSKAKKQLNSSLLRRTTSALESRSKPRNLINRITDYNAIDRRRTQYDPHYEYDQQFDSQQCNPYSLPDAINSFDLEPRYENGHQINYDNEHGYQNQYLAEFETEMQQRCQQTNQNRYSTITQGSNESAFFDCNSPSLAQDNCNTPSIGKQRSRIKTNPWLPSPWMSSNSITNSLNSSDSMKNRQNNEISTQFAYQSNNFDTSINSHCRRTQTTTNNERLYPNENSSNYLNVAATSVKASYSFASTSSSDSGCNVTTNSMDESVLSANNFMNESLMSCSLMTNNSLVDDDEEQILTISHNNGGEQVINQMNVKHYMQQLSSGTELIANDVNICNIPQSSTMDDFGEMSSRAESQLSAIYQQIDELKCKIDEIDLDNGRIEAKMNSLVNLNGNNPKVNLGTKMNASFNDRLNQQNYTFYDALSSNTLMSSMKSNSSEEEIVTSSSSYSPVSSSSSLASSPTSVQNGSTFSRTTNSIRNECSTFDCKKRSNKQESPDDQMMICSTSFNNSRTPSSHRSVSGVSNLRNVNSCTEVTNAERNDLNRCSIDQQQCELVENDLSRLESGKQLERVLEYLKQSDSSHLYMQFKYRNGANIQKLLLNSGRRKSLNSKFVNARRSFGSNLTNSNNLNRLSNGSIKSGCNEAWVSTTTDLLVSSDDEDTVNYVDCVNNKIKSNKYESKNLETESCLPENQRTYELKFNRKKLNLSNSNMPNVDTKQQVLSSNYTSYNSDRDASKLNNRQNELNDRKNCLQINQGKSHIPKPLTPIKVNEKYKRLKPINGSKIPVMRPIIENEFDSPSRDLINQPPSPAPLDRHVNRIDLPRNKNLSKPKAFTFNKKANYNDLCMVSPLTQQLKFERQEQRKLSHSSQRSSIGNYDSPMYNCYKQTVFNQMPNYSPILLLSPPISSDSGLSEFTQSEESHSDNSPLVEQSKNQTLASQIQNLRLELRDVIKVAINEARKDDIFPAD